MSEKELTKDDVKKLNEIANTLAKEAIEKASGNHKLTDEEKKTYEEAIKKSVYDSLKNEDSKNIAKIHSEIQSEKKPEYINKDVEKASFYFVNKEVEKYLKEHPGDEIGAKVLEASLKESYKYKDPNKVLEEQKKELLKDQEKQFDRALRGKTIQNELDKTRKTITPKKISVPVPEWLANQQSVQNTSQEQIHIQMNTQQSNQNPDKQEPDKQNPETNNPSNNNDNNQSQEPNKPNNQMYSHFMGNTIKSR